MTNASFNDTPITSPEHDRFGFDPLAKALARSITNISKPEGTVFAVNGPWGSGKSSVLNLIKHHIAASPSDPPIQIVNFACWWYRGEEAMTLAFLQELFGALKPALPQQAQEALTKLGKRLLKAKDLLGPVMAVLGAAAGAELAKGAADALEKFLTGDESVDVQQARLADELSKQPRRFLVVIDDLDRLMPDEALQVFRLIKSVGRLPNVMYLLAFDRQIAEKVVAEKYPSEGPHYLEKIIQAAFELPTPSNADLNESVLDQISQICGTPDEPEIVHFMNVFYDCIAPFIKSPRDVNRVASTIAVTWPAVRDDVNPADFVAMETLRVLHGAVYRRLQRAKDILAGGTPNSQSQQERAEIKARTDALLTGVTDAQKELLREALQRLFPRTQSIWDGMSYGSDWDGEWQRMRLVCSRSHFDTYFAFSVPDDALAGSLVKELIESTGDPAKLQNLLRDGAQVRRKRGGTRAALLLDEINIRAKSIPLEHIATVVNALYAISDDLDIEEDKGRGFMSMANNELRLHWLTNRLVRERIPPSDRSKLILQATKSAPLGWLVSMANRAYNEHVPEKGDRAVDEAERLCTLAHAEQLKRRALARIRQAAKDGSLLRHRHFPYILFRWHKETAKGSASVASRWLRKTLRDNKATLRVAEAFTHEGWSHGSSDRVARKNVSAGTKSLAELVPLPILRKALETAVADDAIPQSSRDIGRRFLDNWDQQELRRKRGDPEFD